MEIFYSLNFANKSLSEDILRYIEASFLTSYVEPADYISGSN